MAHPIIEALYIGLFAASAVQPVDAPREVTVSDRPCSECRVVSERAPRVVYNWAAGSRIVYRSVAGAERLDAPLVGITDKQIRRMTRLAAG